MVMMAGRPLNIAHSAVGIRYAGWPFTSVIHPAIEAARITPPISRRHAVEARAAG